MCNSQIQQSIRHHKLAMCRKFGCSWDWYNTIGRSFPPCLYPISPNLPSQKWSQVGLDIHVQRHSELPKNCPLYTTHACPSRWLEMQNRCIHNSNVHIHVHNFTCFPDGDEHPVAYTKHTLSSSEQNYSQGQKEALSLVFGIHMFNTYLHGSKFTPVTDRKPLTINHWPLYWDLRVKFLPWLLHTFRDGLFYSQHTRTQIKGPLIVSPDCLKGIIKSSPAHQRQELVVPGSSFRILSQSFSGTTTWFPQSTIFPWVLNSHWHFLNGLYSSGVLLAHPSLIKSCA